MELGIIENTPLEFQQVEYRHAKYTMFLVYIWAQVQLMENCLCSMLDVNKYTHAYISYTGGFEQFF